MSELQENDEEYQKLLDQKKLDEEQIKDTEYIEDEDRLGETTTFSRSLDNLKILLRFLQLLCENHNLYLQQVLCEQKDPGNIMKMKQVNIVSLSARMFEQFQKIINSQTIGIGHGIVDFITESI